MRFTWKRFLCQLPLAACVAAGEIRGRVFSGFDSCTDTIPAEEFNYRDQAD